MRLPEQAEILLRKAAEDEFAIEVLGQNPASSDDVIGFHAQQAVEKTLKAVLCWASVRYRRTHDLVELIDLLRDHGFAFPEDLEQVRRLTRYAALMRYEYLPAEPERPFDREWAADCVRKTRAWAAAGSSGRGRPTAMRVPLLY